MEKRFTMPDLIALLRSLPRVDEDFLRGLEEQDRARKLQAESLVHRADGRDDVIASLRAQLTAAREENARLRAKLSYYEPNLTWRCGHHVSGPGVHDSPVRFMACPVCKARAALDEGKKGG